MAEPQAGCRICEIPQDALIAQSAGCKAFFPSEPIAGAHVVVAVREHLPLLHDLTDEQAAEVMVTARRIAAAIHGLTGVMKFYAASIGDVDLHFHLHLLPRQAQTSGLGPFIFGKEGWAGVQPAETLDPEIVQEMIRSELRRRGF
jgi:diadenosine tetraphosphate (Ap4A) HIT family hydrolase